MKTNDRAAVLLRTCEFVDNPHTPDPEQVLWDIADRSPPARSSHD